MSELLEQLLGSEEDTQKDRYLTFMIKDECYGIEIQYVNEIIGMQTITKVPGLPTFIQGIINLRGKIIPVIDVRIRFNKEQIEYTGRTCVIVIELNHQDIGLIVDQVSDVLTIDQQNMTEPPAFNAGSSYYIQNIGKVKDEVILLLNCKRLLQDVDMDIKEFN